MARKPHKYKFEVGSFVGCPYNNMKDAVKKMSRLLLHHIGKNWKLDYYGEEIVGSFDLPTNLQINLPFELGEFTGKYVDKIDKALGDMITLAGTVDLQNCEVEDWFLNTVLMKVRTFYWACLIGRNNNFFIYWFSDVDPLWATLSLINRWMIQQNFPSKSWILLVLKFNYVLAQSVLFHHKQMVKCGSSSDFVQRTHQMFQAVGDLEIVDVKENCKVWKEFDDVTSLFSRQNDPISLGVLSLEKPETNHIIFCSSCSLQICTHDAQLRPDVFLNKTLLDASASWKGPTIVVHQWSFATFFCCGAAACIITVKNLYITETTESKPSSELVTGFECDYCGLLVIKPHRCSKCKSKQYCSPECQTLDWRLIHMKLCQEYEKEGTRKFDTKERKEILFEAQAKRDFMT